MIVVALFCYVILFVNLSFMTLALTSSRWKRLTCRVHLSVVSVPNVQTNQRLPALKASYEYSVGRRIHAGWRIAYCQVGINRFERSLSENETRRLYQVETVILDNAAYYCPLFPRLSVLITGISRFGLLEYMLRNGLLCVAIYWCLRH